MNAWLLSIVGVVALGVLLEILLSDGQTSKYIKGVFALAVVLVLVAPLPKFFNKNFDINEFFGTEMTTQSTFLNNVNEKKNSEREKKLANALKNENISVDRVRIFYFQNDTNNIDIVKIYVTNDVSQDTVFDIVQKFVKCDKEQVKIYKTG